MSAALWSCTRLSTASPPTNRGASCSRARPRVPGRLPEAPKVTVLQQPMDVLGPTAGRPCSTTGQEAERTSKATNAQAAREPPKKTLQRATETGTKMSLIITDELHRGHAEGDRTRRLPDDRETPNIYANKKYVGFRRTNM